MNDAQASSVEQSEQPLVPNRLTERRRRQRAAVRQVGIAVVSAALMWLVVGA